MRERANDLARPRFGEVAERLKGARLESVFRGNSNEGSNPSLSATLTENNTLSYDVCGLFNWISHNS